MKKNGGHEMRKSFHSLGNKPVLKYLYRAVKAWKQYGLAAMLRMAKHRLKAASPRGAESVGYPIGKLYEDLLKKYEKGEIRGIAIIPSAFEFDELYNQRTINLSKYLSDRGYGVIYVAWQWHRAEALEKNYQYVFKNVIQVPLYGFIETHNGLKVFSGLGDKKYIIMLPAKIFSDLVFFMKDNCFEIFYDIMDDWEGFHEVGQAPWFVKSVEEFVVLNANKVTAVSQPLVRKFSHLRSDIVHVGNGYCPQALSGMANIAGTARGDDNNIIIGYFGHLTDSWFDWELIFDLIDKHENICLEVIGYGQSEAIRAKAERSERIKLLGKVNPRDLHMYASGWDVAVIPFVKSELSEAVDPIKIYEYLYFGLPAAVTGISHLSGYPFVKVTENASMPFYRAIMELYEKKLKKEADYGTIAEFLADKTWGRRFEVFLEPDFISALYRG